MTDYYPGSKVPRKPLQPASPPVPPPELGEPYGFYPVKGRAGVWPMYTLGQLATALLRKPVTLRRWESQGLIPRAPYLVHGVSNLDGTRDKRGDRRLYGLAHVQGIVDIAQEEGLLDNLTKKVKETKFTEKVVALFKELDRI